MVAAAGPAANIFIALVFAVLVRLSSVVGLSEAFVNLSIQIILLNIFLAFFNLVPIPPLDGSKILPRLLPYPLRMKYESFRNYFEQHIALGFALVIILFMVFFAAPLYTATQWLTMLLIG